MISPTLMCYTNNERLCILLQILCYIGTNVCSGFQDPCQTPFTSNDITMQNNYVQGPYDSLKGGELWDYRWYRYTGTQQGLLASSCPHGTQCLTRNQVWSNDTVPGIGCEGIIEVCQKDGNDCCKIRNSIQAKNCGSFMVYILVRLPPKSRFCFQSKQGNVNPSGSIPCTSTAPTARGLFSPSLGLNTESTTLSTKGFVTTTRSSLNTFSAQDLYKTTPVLTSRVTTKIRTNSSMTPTTSRSLIHASATISTKKTLSSSGTSGIQTLTVASTQMMTAISGRTFKYLSSVTTYSKGATPKHSTSIVTADGSLKNLFTVTAIKNQKPDPTRNLSSSQQSERVGLIAGIVVCSVITVCSSVFIAWKIAKRKSHINVSDLSQHRTDLISLQNARKTFDVNRLDPK